MFSSVLFGVFKLSFLSFWRKWRTKTFAPYLAKPSLFFFSYQHPQGPALSTIGFGISLKRVNCESHNNSQVCLKFLFGTYLSWFPMGSVNLFIQFIRAFSVATPRFQPLHYTNTHNPPCPSLCSDNGRRSKHQLHKLASAVNGHFF